MIVNPMFIEKLNFAQLHKFLDIMTETDPKKLESVVLLDQLD